MAVLVRKQRWSDGFSTVIGSLDPFEASWPGSSCDMNWFATRQHVQVARVSGHDTIELLEGYRAEDTCRVQEGTCDLGCYFSCDEWTCCSSP